MAKKRTPYEVLGVDAGASAEVVKKAYRKKARAVHPDRGGDTAEFQVLAHAYSILGDPESRSRYDSVGEQEATPELAGIAQVLSAAFSTTMATMVQNKQSCDQVSVVRMMRQFIQDQNASNEQGLGFAARMERELKKAAKRIKKKGDDGVLRGVIEAELEKGRQVFAQLNARKEAYAGAHLYLSDCESPVDARRPSYGDDYINIGDMLRKITGVE